MRSRCRATLPVAVAALTFACNVGSPYVNGEERLQDLEPYLESRAVWEGRAADVREGILQGAGLSAFPDRTPLRVMRRSRNFGDGVYTVDNVAFESLPGVFVTGNLYMPRRAGPLPAILHPHGHFEEDGWYARTLPDVQLMSRALASMGAVVFTYDMVGWGDMRQLPHTIDFVLALQLWNSIRAVDFVLSLPEVDPTRIGVAGASGGASQAIFLAAVDSRIAASAPIVMVSADHDGGDGCETGMPIREPTDTNNTEIAALMAPRPQLLVSDGDDWTASFPDQDLPFLRRIYDLYGEAESLRNVHLADEGHDLGIHKRLAVYEFFADVFGLDPIYLDENFLTRDRLGRENGWESISYELNSGLVVFDNNFPRPDYALRDPDDVAALLFGGANAPE